MKKISEFENEAAIELLADIMEPAVEILSDEELRREIANNGAKVTLAKTALKNHKKAVLEILARLNGVEPKKFKCNPVSILADLMYAMNDEDLIDFFTSQAKEAQTASSIALVETTEAKEN